MLNSCDENVAATIATLSAGDLMAYIDRWGWTAGGFSSVGEGEVEREESRAGFGIDGRRLGDFIRSFIFMVLFIFLG